MNLMAKTLSAMALCFSFATAFAAEAPEFLITHNKTGAESNAWVNGTASPYPTKAHSDNIIPWNLVRIACFTGVSNSKLCKAEIKMETDAKAPKKPKSIGWITLDLDTGKITPERLSAEGYTIVVTDPVGHPGETTITKDAG